MKATCYTPYAHVLARKGFADVRVRKVPLHGGFTCPNIDGTKATGGCTFCDNVSFSPTLRSGASRVADQLERGKAFYRERFNGRSFLAYFQTFTNTYAPVEKLKQLYDESLEVDDVVGMSIGTRPDCIDADKL
ncbi:MAG TPA: TIGR01212 family radical SAM protein, partial [Fibrobacteria bacterium]|nr:TIGR01212 family radical SAM protein [Fibrobacteria bacterium]